MTQNKLPIQMSDKPMTPSQEAVERIELICTYHSDDGTSGYLLSDEQFKAISEDDGMLYVSKSLKKGETK